MDQVLESCLVVFSLLFLAQLSPGENIDIVNESGIILNAFSPHIKNVAI